MGYARQESVPLDPGKDLVFQITNWYTCDDNSEDDDVAEYLVKVFGVTEDGRSVSANLTEFPPFFYVKCPYKINDYQLRMVKEHVVEKIYPPKLRNGLLDVKIMHKKDFWGFTNNTKFTFIRLSFKNVATFRAAAKIFTRKLYIRDFGSGDGVFLKLYENNIDPFLRLAHIKNIDPAGWVRLPAKTYSANRVLPTRCQIDVTTRWSEIESVHLEKMAPLVIAGFDIECTSSHGDFPVAMKTYKKTALEIYIAYNGAPEDYPKERVQRELLAIFDHSEKGSLSKVYPKRYVNPKDLERPLTVHLDDIYNTLMGRMHIRAAPAAKPVFGLLQAAPKEKSEMTRDAILKALTDILGRIFPALEGDPIIQIGTTVHTYGEKDCGVKHIVTLGSCDPIEGAIVEACKSERDLLLKWRDLVNTIDPDVMIGYNIFGFDMAYMYERAHELGIAREFSGFGRIKDHVEIMYERDNRYCPLVEKMLSSSALGDNLLRYIDAEGRVLIDMMKVVQRDHKLDSYKLDAVSSHFLGGKILSCFENVAVFDNAQGITPGSYVRAGDDKHRVVSISEMPDGEKGFRVELDPPPLPSEKAWGLAKDDISPREIFECQAGTSADRARIARYCIKDCALCNYLLMKLETLANNVGMANVCSVPLSYIFMRGQGIKIFSLVAKKCREDDYLIPCLTKYQNRPEEEEEDEEGYEGAIVLDPKEGIYLDTPISVLDYASLYPSSMISENLSHDCIVLDSKYDNLPGMEYLDICYDIYEKQDNKKVKTGVRTCRFVQLPEKGVIPRILMHLLKQRKLTRKKIEFETVTGEAGIPVSGIVTEMEDSYKITALDGTVTLVKKPATVEDTYDDFQKAVLDGLQLAYKVTANSLYGQCGARTSQIYMKDVAACTTATGRKMIMMACQFILKKSVKFDVQYEPEIIYGDTDSVFAAFHFKNPDGTPITGKAAVPLSRELGIAISKEFKKTIKPPHDLEWEKLFWPFILFSKKRYCANKYEHDDNKYKFNSMGIVLKRRDNAHIVKTIYGGVIDIIMNRQDIPASISFLNEKLQELVEGKFPLEELVITKSLKADYKDPLAIAHKVLADRMGERDEGSRPQVNDRIPFVYIQTPPAPRGKKVLQGERIEHPDYIRAHSIKPDYEFYITNQIMTPVLQLYALVLEDLKGYRANVDYKQVKEKLLKEKDDPKKAIDKYKELREAEVKKLLFDPILIKLQNKRVGNKQITDFFGPKTVVL